MNHLFVVGGSSERVFARLLTTTTTPSPKQTANPNNNNNNSSSNNNPIMKDDMEIMDEIEIKDDPNEWKNFAEISIVKL